MRGLLVLFFICTGSVPARAGVSCTVRVPDLDGPKLFEIDVTTDENILLRHDGTIDRQFNEQAPTTPQFVGIDQAVELSFHPLPNDGVLIEQGVIRLDKDRIITRGFNYIEASASNWLEGDSIFSWDLTERKLNIMCFVPYK